MRGDCPRRTYKKPYDQCIRSYPYFSKYLTEEYTEKNTNRIGKNVRCCKTRDCKTCKVYFYYTGKNDDTKMTPDINKKSVLLGPRVLYYYEIVVNKQLTKKILLCGETHKGHNPCNENVKCMFMDTMIGEIHNILKTKNKCLDLFLETSPKPGKGSFYTGGTRMTTNTPTLQTLRNIYKNTDSENNIRVQRWDLRQNKNGLIKELHDVLYIYGNDVEEWESLIPFDINKWKSFYSVDTNSENEDVTTPDMIDFKKSIINLLRYLLGVDLEPNAITKKIIGLFSQDSGMFKFRQMTASEIIHLKIQFKLFNKYRERLTISTYKNFLSYILDLLPSYTNPDDDNISPIKMVLNDRTQYGKNRDFDKIYNDKQILYYLKIPRPALKENDIIRTYISTHFDIKTEEDQYSFMGMVIEVWQNKKMKEAIHREYNFYVVLEKLHTKINKTYSKFLEFNRETRIFTKDIREEYINVLTNDRNISNIINGGLFGFNAIESCVTDLYTILRMFQKFVVKNTTNPCDSIDTPEHILVYGGSDHIHIYEDFLNIFFDCILKIESKSDNQVDIKTATINKLEIDSFDKLIHTFTR